MEVKAQPKVGCLRQHSIRDEGHPVVDTEPAGSVATSSALGSWFKSVGCMSDNIPSEQRSA
jgi:hypothetical protein